MDHEAERARLHKEKEKLERELARVSNQLGNEEFRTRAPRDVVRGVENRHSQLSLHYRKVLDSIERLD